MKKIDFHIHTIPTISDSDFNFELTKVKEYVDRLNIDAIAITNHNLFDQNQFNLIKGSLSMTVFPGIEINLDGGHLLLIADNDEFEVSNFDEKCKLVTAKIISNTDSLSLAEFETIFPELNKYILIPHYDKASKLKQLTIEALQPHITSCEVASVSKFKRMLKEQDSLRPVLFSDIRKN